MHRTKKRLSVVSLAVPLLILAVLAGSPHSSAAAESNRRIVAQDIFFTKGNLSGSSTVVNVKPLLMTKSATPVNLDTRIMMSVNGGAAIPMLVAKGSGPCGGNCPIFCTNDCPGGPHGEAGECLDMNVIGDGCFCKIFLDEFFAGHMSFASPVELHDGDIVTISLVAMPGSVAEVITSDDAASTAFTTASSFSATGKVAVVSSLLIAGIIVIWRTRIMRSKV
jgi:hypothetical protein